MGFWHVNTIAICINRYVGAVSSFRECGLPCGLRGSLCTLQLCCSALHLYLLHSCNTRYEWLAKPYSAGTFTLQEAPSFAWRTNGLRYAPSGHRWAGVDSVWEQEKPEASLPKVALAQGKMLAVGAAESRQPGGRVRE